MSKFKNIALTGCALVFGAVSYTAFKGYKLSAKPSNLELALQKLDFNGYRTSSSLVTKATEQESLLKILYFAGYFSPEQLWRDINKIGKIENTEKAFQSIYNIIVKAGANQADPNKFNVKLLRKNLFNSDLDSDDAKDLIFYISQHAFRKLGQERNELTSKNWMEKYKEEYFSAAKLLRLIDRESPTLKEYDEGWIAGASRIGVLARLIDHQYTLSKNIKVTGETLILAGQRELWADIDGITPKVLDRLLEARKNSTDLDLLDISLLVGKDEARVKEGKEYMEYLAKQYNIPLVPESPFIQYASKEECPNGRFPARVYANYTEGTPQKLTETIMSADLLSTYFGNQRVSIVDTLTENHTRPNTATTARDAAEKLVKKIEAGEYGDKKSFVILFESNQPYIERQTLGTQTEIDKILKQYGLDKKGYTIKIEGIGFGNKQDIPVIHSEIAALIAEKWKNSEIEDENLGISSKRPIKDLLFQTRNAESEVPIMPVDFVGGASFCLIQYFKDFFDNYLE